MIPGYQDTMLPRKQDGVVSGLLGYQDTRILENEQKSKIRCENGPFDPWISASCTEFDGESFGKGPGA